LLGWISVELVDVNKIYLMINIKII